jgi:cytochrome oxidase Cu insertion factor (SCO1/SenC/PrrC family)
MILLCCAILCCAVLCGVRVYFHKTGDSDTDYLVDHSIIMYLIDPAGDFVTFYGEQPESHMLRAIWVLGFRVWG